MKINQSSIEKFRKTHFSGPMAQQQSKPVSRISTAREKVTPYENMFHDFQSISVNLYHLTMEQNAKIIGFVSPLPMSGVSTSTAFISYLVSATNARPADLSQDALEDWITTDRGVLVIDAQLRNPSLHQKFNVSLQPGLCDIVPLLGYDSDDIRIENAIAPIPNTNIHLLPGGNKDKRHLSLEEVSRLRLFVQAIKYQYSYIFLDLPPLLTVSESAALAGLCDGVILVIESGKTKKKDIEHSLNKLGNLNINVLGTILNKQKTYVPQWIQNLI